MGIKRNGKPPQWEWELPALPCEFIPTAFLLRRLQMQLVTVSSQQYGWLNVRSLAKKTVAVHEAIVAKNLDILSLTGTWHYDTRDICLLQGRRRRA